VATPPQPAQGRLTAEEFARRPDPGYPEELVKGTLVTTPPPGARHGEVCARAISLLKLYLMTNDLGRVLSNDAGVITERGPDSVRGPDVSYYSYAKLPKGPTPKGYPGVPPDLALEVVSPDDRWPKMLAKVAEYLNAGVAIVGVLDPERRTLHLYDGDDPVRVLAEGDDLALPALLGDFQVPVSRFFG
jgi:Uma2 family endonuclease